MNIKVISTNDPDKLPLGPLDLQDLEVETASLNLYKATINGEPYHIQHGKVQLLSLEELLVDAWAIPVNGEHGVAKITLSVTKQ